VPQPRALTDWRRLTPSIATRPANTQLVALQALRLCAYSDLLIIGGSAHIGLTTRGQRRRQLAPC
jgi:hypothetical protein